jgi:segregation and condensation protein B
MSEDKSAKQTDHLHMSEHARALEALLFISGEPLTIREVSKYLELDKSGAEEAVQALTDALQGRGIVILRHNESVALATAPEVTEIASRIAKERLEGNLTKTQLETLSIILWKGKVSRTSIDYVRGVNSAFALRSLLVRGLIERVQDSKDARIFLYSPTLEFYKYLGISSGEELPEYDGLKKSMQEI